MIKSLGQALRRAWQAWTRLARKIGDFQARVLLSGFYAVLVFPFGAMVRLFADPLRIKKRPTEWLDHPEDVQDLQWARKQ